jgi:hypothetical protein
LSQIKAYLNRNRFGLLWRRDRAGEAELHDLLDEAGRLGPCAWISGERWTWTAPGSLYIVLSRNIAVKMNVARARIAFFDPRLCLSGWNCA